MGVIRSLRRPRQDWEEASRAMAESGDDSLLDESLLAQTQWDEADVAMVVKRCPIAAIEQAVKMLA